MNRSVNKTRNEKKEVNIMAARTKIGARIPELITRRLIVDPCVNAVVKTAGLIAAYRVIKKKIEESSAARAAAAESRGDAP